MKHLPTVEALTNTDDRRLLAELEICQVIEKLARVRALVDRADDLLANVLAGADRADDGRGAPVDEGLFLALLASIRKTHGI